LRAPLRISTHPILEYVSKFADPMWSLACNRALLSKDSLDPHSVDSMIELLAEAFQNAPEFREDLATEKPRPRSGPAAR
jgi:hypothetical protein